MAAVVCGFIEVIEKVRCLFGERSEACMLKRQNRTHGS